MLRKLVIGTLASLTITILLALGNASALLAPQLWLLLLVGVTANVFQPAYNPFDKSGTAEDRGTALQILWSVYLTQGATVIEAVYVRYPDSLRWNVATTVGLIFMIVGLVLRTWAVFALGRYFTWHISVQGGQRVIRNGPYRFVRHPSYAGAFLTYVFSAVFLHAWCSAGIASVALALAFSRRIRHEEIVLKERLGEDYEMYCREVGALVPGLGSLGRK